MAVEFALLGFVCVCVCVRACACVCVCEFSQGCSVPLGYISPFALLCAAAVQLRTYTTQLLSHLDLCPTRQLHMHAPTPGTSQAFLQAVRLKRKQHKPKKIEPYHGQRHTEKRAHVRLILREHERGGETETGERARTERRQWQSVKTYK